MDPASLDYHQIGELLTNLIAVALPHPTLDRRSLRQDEGTCDTARSHSNWRPDGGHTTRLVNCGGHCTETRSAAWTADGTRLAFVAECFGVCGSAGDPYHGIRVLDVRSGQNRLVAPGDDFLRLLLVDRLPRERGRLQDVAHLCREGVAVRSQAGERVLWPPTVIAWTAAEEPDAPPEVRALAAVPLTLSKHKSVTADNRAPSLDFIPLPPFERRSACRLFEPDRSGD